MISEKSLSQRMTTTSLNSSDHPNLSFIYPLMISGMSLIKIIPNILQMTPPSVDVEQFLQPFMFLTKQYRLVPDLALFKCWSPAPRPPLKRLLIDRHMISSNTGEPLKAVNDTQHQYWTCPSKGGVLTVTFDRPTSVASVNIAWAPLQPASSSSLTCSAPRKLHVLVRRFPGSPLELLSTIDVDEERKRTRSWVHEYKIGGCETIFALHLQPEGLSQFNQSTSDPIKVYNISVFSEDSDATWVNTMSLVQDYQQILYTFHNFDCLEVDMYSTLFTLPRVTGSLLSLLDLLLHFDDLNASLKLRSDVQRFFSVWTSIHHLLAAVQKTHCLLQEGIMSSITSQESTKNLTKEITFDENAKSPDMIISEEGRLITCNSGGNSYGLIDCEMENGVWEWEITITRDNHGDETSCLGVARRPVTNCNYDTTSDMWLIRCYNGDTYHCGRLPKKRSIPQIHPNDICKFTFDCDTRTLSLMVNDIDIGVIFDNLDSGISPAVSFYGSGKSIKLLSIKQIRNTNCLDGINLADLSTIPDTPSVEHLMTSKFDIVAEILHRISELVKLHLVIFGADKTKGNLESTLEYPFAIQVCYEVFESILALLQKSYQSNDIRTMISLLIILKGQFACLTRADVDPSVAGFGISGLHTNSNNVLHLGHSLLSSLMNHSDSQLKIVAAETFSQGIQFFLPDTSQKLKFTVDTVANIYPLHSSESELAQFIVLKTMIKKLAHCGEVLKMINSFYRLPNDENLVPRLINFCLQLTVDITLLDSNGTSSLLNSNDFRESLYKLISTYQEQLLVDIISEDPPHGALFLCTDYFKNLCLKVDTLLDHFEQ